MGAHQYNLIVCPSSLVSHWKSEVSTYFDENTLTCNVYDPHSRPIYNDSNSNICPTALIVSYSQIRKDIAWFTSESEIAWGFIVLDEGHLIRNSKTGK